MPGILSSYNILLQKTQKPHQSHGKYDILSPIVRVLASFENLADSTFQYRKSAGQPFTRSFHQKLIVKRLDTMASQIRRIAREDDDRSSRSRDRAKNAGIALRANRDIMIECIATRHPTRIYRARMAGRILLSSTINRKCNYPLWGSPRNFSRK